MKESIFCCIHIVFVQFFTFFHVPSTFHVGISSFLFRTSYDYAHKEKKYISNENMLDWDKFQYPQSNFWLFM